MNDIQRQIYASQKGADEENARPCTSLKEVLEIELYRDVLYVADLVSASCNDSLPVLAARMGEDRAAFLEFLKDVGVESLQHRQRVCNAIGKALRLGQITKGWESKPEGPSECDFCGARAGPNTKLLCCARCKAVKYCGAACQKKAWAAGHKAVCQRPEPERDPRKQSFGAEPPKHTNALPSAFVPHSYPHGFSHLTPTTLDPRPNHDGPYS